MFQQILKFVAIWAFSQVVINAATQYFRPNSAANAPNPITSDASSLGGGSASDLSAFVPREPSNAHPIWPSGTPLSISVYLDTLDNEPTQQSDLNAMGIEPIARLADYPWGDVKAHKEVDLFVNVPESVQHNGTWFADIFVERPEEVAPTTPKEVHYRKQVSRFVKKRKIRREKNLLDSSAAKKGIHKQSLEEKEEEERQRAIEVAEDAAQPIVGHWARNLTLTIVGQDKPININTQAPVIKQHLKYLNVTSDPDSGSGSASADGLYFPILFPNDFWQIKEDFIPVNSSTPTLPLRITVDHVSNMKFTIYAGMTDAFDKQQSGSSSLTGGSGGSEIDELKKMLLQANPFWLAVTIVVTLLHTLFEFLAFSSDVSHWRKKDKDLVGVSFRSIVTNVVVQLIILLYLHDSSEETSFMILMSQGMGLLVEAWKVTKVVDIRIRPVNSLIPYRISFEDKHELTEDEKKTQEYDKEAFKIVGIGAVPLLSGYAVYSLLYKTHRSWYSYIITTLAQAVYLFGFAQLVPQLIINYKLKSVAHMPMKAMIYKTLTTIVDDCASFVIHMPWLHRLACFRDDVVFAILLYQRWIYRIDYSRANEYGQIAEKPDEKDAKAKHLKSE